MMILGLLLILRSATRQLAQAAEMVHQEEAEGVNGTKKKKKIANPTKKPLILTINGAQVPPKL